MVCCSIFNIYFSDFCQPKYLNSYQTDLHEIFRVCRTLAVVEQSEARDVAMATNCLLTGPTPFFVTL